MFFIYNIILICDRCCECVSPAKFTWDTEWMYVVDAFLPFSRFMVQTSEAYKWNAVVVSSEPSSIVH